jgi:hypothetical protein
VLLPEQLEQALAPAPVQDLAQVQTPGLQAPQQAQAELEPRAQALLQAPQAVMQPMALEDLLLPLP